MIIILILIIVGIILLSIITSSIIKENNLDVRRYNVLNKIRAYQFDDNVLPRMDIVNKCIEIGLLQEEDLYIDLTGGESTYKLSDEKLLSLRIYQNCSNNYEYRGSTNLVFDDMTFYLGRHKDLTGNWVWTDNGSFLDRSVGWYKSDSYAGSRYATGKEEDMYIDKGSGNRIREEWNKKLFKIKNAAEKYKEMKEEERKNALNAKFNVIDLKY